MKLDETTVPGINHKVRLQDQIETSDLTGAQSSTERGYRGWKAWIVQVTLEIPMEDTRTGQEAQDFRFGPLAATLMRALFQAPDEGGQPKLYQVDDFTCAAWGITRARFHETLQVVENATLRKWDVSFTLKEERSIPERDAERQPDAPKVAVPQLAGGIEGLLARLEPLAEKASKFLFSEAKP